MVGYLGWDTTHKGFHLLPDIIRELKDMPILWLIFADQHPGALPSTWMQLRAMSGLGVHLVGRVDDVRRAYEQCDIVLCPSYRESFCRVAAEAMINGLPVVGSDLEPIRELLGDREAGLTFPPGDVLAAAKEIGLLASDPDLRASLGQAGRERAARFEPVDIACHMARLYRHDVASI
jgi:glycosyltransferase involved in cell wall biosynthesis